MSLADDQILNNSYNALDELARRINRTHTKEAMKAAQIVVDYETDIERAKIKEPGIGTGKTVIDPEKLLDEIKEDMTR